MAVNLANIRDELLPGLMALQYSFATTKEIYAANAFNAAFAVVPTAEIPMVSLPLALAAGAALAIIKNPEISRRGFIAWGSRV
jgi:hypothetical protein